MAGGRPASPGLSSAANWLIHSLAAVFGLGATAYAIGACVLWLQLATSPWPRDVAVEHAPRASVIALGVPPALAVGALATAYVVTLVLWRANFRKAGRWLSSRLPHPTLIGLIALTSWVAGVIVLGLCSWWASIVAAGTGLLVLLGVSYVHTRRVRPVANTALVVGSFAIFFLGAVALEYSAATSVPTIVFARPLPKILQQPKLRVYLDRQRRFWTMDGGLPLPYFGRDDSYVYVGKISSIAPNPKGGFWINFCPGGPPREIVAVPLTAMKNLVYAGDTARWSLFKDKRLPPLQQLFGSKPKQPQLNRYEANECKALAQT